MTEACADLCRPDDGRRRGRVPDLPGPGDRGPRPTARPTRPPARWPTRCWSSARLNGEDAYWGRVASDLGSAGVGLRHGPAGHRLRRGDGVPGRASPSTTTRPRWPRHLAGSLVDIHCQLGSGRRQRRGHGRRPRLRLHRREPDHLVSAAPDPRDAGRRRLRAPRATRPRCWSSRCPTSVGSGARWWWSSTAATCCSPKPGEPAGRRGGGPGLVRRGHRPHALGGHAAGGGPRRWAPDRRADGAGGQGGRVPGRVPGHRRRHHRPGPDGAGGQGQPGHRELHQRPRCAGRRAVGRGRQPDHRRGPLRGARLRRRRGPRRPGHRPPAAGPGPDPGGGHHRHRPLGAGLQHQRRHRGRGPGRRPRGREAGLPHRRVRAAGRCPTTRPR